MSDPVLMPSPRPLTGLLVALALLAIGCAPEPQCKCAQVPAALLSAAPVTSAAPAAQPSDPLVNLEPAPEGIGWIEIDLGGERQLLQAKGEQGADAGPYVEILDPNTATPRFILDSRGSGGVHFDIVGHATRLPGSVDVMRLRFQDVPTGQEWTSTSLVLEVTEFGDQGKPVAGTFRGMMSARLNKDAVPIQGRFKVFRAADRFAP